MSALLASGTERPLLKFNLGAARHLPGSIGMNLNRFLRAIATLAIAFSVLVSVDGAGAGASSRPMYPLGAAKYCKSHYVKRTERHRVNGRLVPFVACVYFAPPVTTTTTTTTTTIPVTPADVVANVLDGQLLDDYLAFDFNGLPTPPDVDALPGDQVYLLGFATDEFSGTPSGTMSFFVNGVAIPSCVGIPVENDGASPAKSEAQCNYEFNTSGPVSMSISFQGSDGSNGLAQSTLNIATPDEVAIIDNECLLVTFGSC